MQAMETGKLRIEGAAGLDAVRRGFGPDHMLARKSQQLFEEQFGKP